MLGKIKLTRKSVDSVSVDSKKISLTRKESDCDSNKDDLRMKFYDPIIELINNQGFNKDGILIADADGLEIIADIIHAIIYDTDVSPIEIIEKAVLQTNEEEEIEEEIISEDKNTCIKIHDEFEESEEDNLNEGDEEQEEEEEEDEEWEEEELEDYREHDYYLQNSVDDRMDDY